jgi:ketosteroid isomerase-like protein
VTTNLRRAETLTRALRAAIDGDLRPIADALTDDVKAWTPALNTSSRSELFAAYDQRDGAFSELELEVVPLDVGGDYACAEWTVTMTHTGPLSVADGHAVEPTGLRVTVHGATVAEFRGEQICGLRQYWDEFAVLEQLGVLREATVG